MITGAHSSPGTDLATSSDEATADPEFHRWSRLFAGPSFYYGHGPGPVARRAVRYHRPLLPRGGTALDAGSGEGQDLAYLCEQGYAVTGIEWTPEGAAKSRRMLASSKTPAKLVERDLREWHTNEQFDLVLAVNSLQFLGSEAPTVLRKLMDLVAPGGVFGLSVFAREETENEPLHGTLYYWTLDEILASFVNWQPLEAASLWQWGAGGKQPFVTLIAAKM